MTTKTHIDAIRRDILESPDDDGLRLILADMLRDSGDPRDVAEGEFVALSMRYASLPYWECGGCLDLPMCGPCEVYDAIGECDFDGYCDHLRRPGDKPTYEGLLYWRGLLYTWAVADVPTFEAQAKDVFGKHPIRRVVLRCEVSTYSNRRRYGRDHSLWRAPWPNRDNDDVPPAIFDLLTGGEVCSRGRRSYATSALARADLEAACVRYGRMVAGLPALEAPR